MRFIMFLVVVCFASITFGQEEQRLIIDFGRTGVKNYRLQKMSRLYQPPKDYAAVFRRHMGDVVQLIADSQRRLDVSDEQFKEINAIYSRFHLQENANSIERSQRLRELWKLSKEDQEIEKPKWERERFEKRETLHGHFGDEVQGVLVPRQLEILTSIRFEKAVEREGLVWAITRAPVSQHLEITKNQAEALNRIKGEGEKELVEAFREFEQRVQRIKKGSMKKVIDALNRNQQKKLSEFNDRVQKLPNPKL